jgi:hypothetical protein
MVHRICILYGCSVPVVLRPIRNSESCNEFYYELIGECYVHGMMDGEAFLARTKAPQSFELR